MLPPGSIPDLSASKNSGRIICVVFQEPAKPFTTLHRVLTRFILVDRWKEEDIALPLMIPLVMKMLYILHQRMAE
jgi:hypothetical protein